MGKNILTVKNSVFKLWKNRNTLLALYLVGMGSLLFFIVCLGILLVIITHSGAFLSVTALFFIMGLSLIYAGKSIKKHNLRCIQGGKKCKMIAAYKVVTLASTIITTLLILLLHISLFNILFELSERIASLGMLVPFVVAADLVNEAKCRFRSRPPKKGARIKTSSKVKLSFLRRT